MQDCGGVDPFTILKACLVGGLAVFEDRHQYG